jgi:hypothetical protein
MRIMDEVRSWVLDPYDADSLPLAAALAGFFAALRPGGPIHKNQACPPRR